MGHIKQLEESVINRIAAGEIIVAPVNALKEMLENSIDAGATSINIIVKDGGIKLLQITDNGSGVEKDDLPILCRRFTTSKLTNFDDLNQLETYGFRGEALASISHIAHVSVVTKNKSSSCAWKAYYSDGELVPGRPNESEQPKPVAGKQGTQITVEDFFYNVPSRLRALRSSSDEFSKILDVIGRYAIHTDGVGFSCKKFGDSNYSLSTRNSSSIKDKIRTVYDSSIVNELIPFKMDPHEKYGLLNVNGLITNSNYNNKKSIQPIFFINNRLVSNDPLKRSLMSTVSHFLPKGYKPFIYLSLKIDTNNLDVNIHPTKREVRFLFEDEIIDLVCTCITAEYQKIDVSRTFSSQSLLPSVARNKVDDIPKPSQTTPYSKKIRLDYNFVRTDSSQSKLTPFFSQSLPETQLSSSIQSDHHSDNNSSHNHNHNHDHNHDHDHEDNDYDTTAEQELISPEKISKQNSQLKIDYIEKERVHVNLKSILELREEIESTTSTRLTEMFSRMTYVGIVDSERRLFAFQFDVKLILADYAAIFNQFFYQIALREFSNFGSIHFDCDPKELELSSLLSHVYKNDAIKPQKDIEEVIQTISSIDEMLLEYFNIEIEKKQDKVFLKTLPLLIKEYAPPLSKLPLFLYRLGAKVDLTEEKSCLRGILQEIALLYIPEPFKSAEDLADDDPGKPLLIERYEQVNELMENILVPNLKKNFLALLDLEPDIIEVASLPGLYKVFERC